MKRLTLGLRRFTLSELELAAAGLLGLLVACLHLRVMLGVGALTSVEVTSVNLAQSPSLASFWKLLSFDSFPVPFYLVLHLWSGITGGTNEAFRWFGLLVGLCTLGALFFNARTVGGCLPLLSLALYGMNATALRDGGIIRGYGLGTLFLVLTFSLVWRLARSPTPLTALLAALSTVGATQSLYQNSVFVLAICAGGMAVTLQQRLWKRTWLILSVGAVAAVLMLPYVPIIRHAQRNVVPWQCGSLDQALRTAAETLSSSGPFMLGAWGVLLVLGVATAAAALFPEKFSLPLISRDRALYAGVALAVGLVGFWIFFSIANFEMAEEYYLLPMALAAVVLDALVGVLPETSLRRWLVLCVGLGVSLLALPNSWQRSHQRYTNINEIAAQLGSLAAKDDLVAVIPWSFGTSFKRYYQGVCPWISIPESDHFEVECEDQLASRLVMTNAAASALEKIAATLKSGHTVWLVGKVEFLPHNQLPPSLPPAPLGPQGWDAHPYFEMWSQETAYLLQTHAARARLLRAWTEGVAYGEITPLAVFEGWH